MDIKAGDTYSRHSFGVVTSVRGSSITLKNTAGLEWAIDREIFEKEFKTANYVQKTEQVNRTQAIELLNSNAKTAMTVCFRTKVDPKDVAEALANGRGEATDRAWKIRVREVLEGTQRIMVGHHNNAYDEHRRLRFEEQGAGMKLVDPRTIDYIIVGGTKYEVT